MYRQAEIVQDDTVPVLVPLAVALIAAAICIAVAVFVIPWEAIPAPTICETIPIKSIWGNIKGSTQICSPDNSDRNWVAFAVVLGTVGAVFLSVVATIRGLTVRNSRNA